MIRILRRIWWCVIRNRHDTIRVKLIGLLPWQSELWEEPVPRHAHRMNATYCKRCGHVWPLQWEREE